MAIGGRQNYNRRMNSPERFERFSWAVLAYNLFVIVWGAFVRATGSGAGCGAHWPMCNGEVVPHSPSMQTVIEFTHRSTSGIALVLVVIQLVWAFRLFEKGNRTRTLAIATMIFMLLEAAVGAAIVLLRHVAYDPSAARAGWIAVHLINTFLLVAALTLTPWSVRHGRDRAPHRELSPALLLGAVLVLITGVAGAITALGDTLFPAESLAQGMAADLSPTAHFLVRLRVIHPLIAVAATLYLLGLAGFVAQTRKGLHLRTFATSLAGLLLAQIAAGLLNLWWLAPVSMQLVHLLLADFVWIAFVLFADVARRSERITALSAAPHETH